MPFELDNPLHLSILAVTVTYLLYRARQVRKISIADVPGPKNSSFLRGNLGEFLRGEAGEFDFKWQSEFGGVVRFAAPLGGELLLISDPKAVNHIIQGYTWGKSAEGVARDLFLIGPSITSTHGKGAHEDHKRHRRIMNPAFGLAEAKALVPVFAAAACSVSNKWKDLLLESGDQSQVFNIPEWASRATLDAIGHAGFDYDFGAMERRDNRLASAYHNLFANIFAPPSDKQLINNAVMSAVMPVRLMSWMFERMSQSNPQLAHGRTMRETSREVAREVVAEKSKEILGGQDGRVKDVMSLLVKANSSPQNDKSRLSDEELMAQMLAMFIAGHETTANTISWSLLELSRRPEIQTKLRAEIHKKEGEIAAERRQETGFTAEDFESLPYLNAVVKECLRYHTVATRLIKTAFVDDCLPLSEPIRTTKGVEINELPVPKGTKAYVSVAAYNRSEALFGDEPHEFRPERWLEKAESGPRKGAANTVYSNLMTFSGGVRSCIGWRFALFEFQAFLVELIGKFEFSLTPESGKIRRQAAGVMLPTIEGEVEKGVQCPLRVRFAKRDE